MRPRVLPVARSFETGLLVRGACPREGCGGDLTGDRQIWASLKDAYACTRCGGELAASVEGETATVGLPYSADEWEAVRSSNLAAVGRKGEHLLVRFNKGSTYLYRGAGEHFARVRAAPSAGKYFAAAVRPLPAERLCAAYSCARTAKAGDYCGRPGCGRRAPST